MSRRPVDTVREFWRTSPTAWHALAALLPPGGDGRWPELCHSLDFGAYAARRWPVSDLALVGLHDGAVVGLLLALRPGAAAGALPDFAACQPHEWYLDVLAVHPDARGGGRLLLERFLAIARARGGRAVRLYALPGAARVWWRRRGFREAETHVGGGGVVVYGRTSSFRSPAELYRMTLVLDASPPAPARQCRSPPAAVVRGRLRYCRPVQR